MDVYKEVYESTWVNSKDKVRILNDFYHSRLENSQVDFWRKTEVLEVGYLRF